MRSDTFDFEIPPSLIAQEPAARRDESRLLVVRRGAGEISHHVFRDLPQLLEPQDLLVLNNTRVQPCRLHCKREGTGGHVELFLLRRLGGGGGATLYEALTGSWRNVPNGARVELPHGGGFATLLEKNEAGHWTIRLDMPAPEADDYVHRAAKMPLPPYIKREREDDQYLQLDRERYQTVFAQNDGAVAAPTAGLHFTPEVFAALAARGIGHEYLTLHVGPGTFRPLKSETLAEHPMHTEEYSVSPATSAGVANARANGGRIVVVGTTSCRTLETVSNEHGIPQAGSGATQLFIYPPYRFRCTDALVTNFHLPHSTLIFLVAAWLGVDLTRRAYLEALEHKYRFFSYGDAMLCLP
ncbi:MAG: tRNA preQ1(34) S-adenosylmethionine ribosyltransferase-isomerase QueA [Planctomycetes bacterium]|nr:tRNA preQ1(34) S-adenosylmethionine ribosyltransferase-isomerase QueA [Planctomycetota bacterium]